jgi:DNA-binding MarR family transcriptional regulator
MNEQFLKTKKLSPQSKLFLLWLKEQEGSTTMKNVEIAVFFDVTSTSVNNWLNQLENEGEILIVYEKKKRTILVSNMSMIESSQFESQTRLS